MDRADIKNWSEGEEYKLLCEGSDLEERGKFDAAARIYVMAAKRGSVICMTNLANTLDDHASVKDPESAVDWYKKAYRSGFAPAAYNLGIHYKTAGKGRWQVFWLKRAADMGDEDAKEELAALGLMQREGPSQK